MKIKNISCIQFAGIHDHNVTFSDGINILYGKNESGKSTTVNMIARTLFQNAKLDKRTSKDFLELYFPAANRNGSVPGDFIDGTLTFETEQGAYILKKEWSTDAKNARCIFSTPDGVVRDQQTIDGILKEVLRYGEGVYSDFLFPSQSNTNSALRDLMDYTKKTESKQEIVNAVSQAFAESGGVSVDILEEKIQSKIKEISGKYWDFERDSPMRRSSGRHSRELGEILKAYYAMEDAKIVLDEISRLESESVQAANVYADRDKEMQTAEAAYNKFNSYAGVLGLRNERKRARERVNSELGKIRRVLTEWPNLQEKLNQARRLQVEKGDRELLDNYKAAKALMDEKQKLEAAASACCPTDSEINQVKSVQREISRLENQLCGMNLTAAINMLDGNTIEITSAHSGRKININDGTASIGEAVKITVPGVMEMTLSPANVDVSAIEKEISDKQNLIADIFGRYSVDTIEKLNLIVDNVSKAKASIDVLDSRLSMLLNAMTFEELEASALAVTDDIRMMPEIDSDIAVFCENGNIMEFIVANETIIGEYESEYGNICDLQAKVRELETELEKTENLLSKAENIPAEYEMISNVDEHLETLKNDLGDKRARREKALTDKTTIASKLEGYQENISVDPVADFEEKKRIFSETKSLLHHWLHIRKVFLEQKENLNANPLQDIAESFTRYLGLITDGRISSEFPEMGRLAMQVYSDNRLIDYKKLSEGTKETVSLAFRIAVLDHLFPEGGGLIVLDDPFADMDAERTAAGCQLLKECAKRHQVIFLTCREEYIDMLNGNVIDISQP